MNELGCRPVRAAMRESSVKVMCRSPRSFRYKLEEDMPACEAAPSTVMPASRSAALILLATMRVASSTSMHRSVPQGVSPYGADLAGRSQRAQTDADVLSPQGVRKTCSAGHI